MYSFKSASVAGNLPDIPDPLADVGKDVAADGVVLVEEDAVLVELQRSCRLQDLCKRKYPCSGCHTEGHTEVDIATARNTGMDLIMVSWGFRPVSYQKALGAKVIVNSADEIYTLVAEGTVQR